MKWILSVVCLLISVSLYAESPQIVCDENTGICRVVNDKNIAVAEEIPAADSNKNIYPEVIRRQIGSTDVPEFMAFLKGENSPADSKTFWAMLFFALIGGLALNLTPCVLPMLPVNLAIIGASGGSQGFRRGLLYGIGMAAAYGVLGLLAAFAGIGFGTLNSSPLFNFAIALIFLILSLGMAGVYNIDLAARWRINPAKFKFSMDFTALFMGAVSALLAGACVAPVVISVLIYAAKSGFSGCLIPFALGIGMALPWPLAGAGWSVLPKPGRFMVVLKYVFALIIFGAAVYYTICGIRLLPEDDISAELNGFAALEDARDKSAVNGKPILVKFTASWCKNCHDMEKTTLKDPDVIKYIRDNFNMVTFPAENPADPEIANLLEYCEIPGFPAFAIMKAESVE